MRPVAQKGQPTAQPTWVLTQIVDRRRERGRAGVSIATVSTVWPSPSRQSSFTVRPASASLSAPTLTVENCRSAASAWRSAKGN